MTDLNALKIDRSRSSGPRHRRGGLGRWIGLALVVAAVWLFRAPLESWVDRLRLPEVSVIRVRKTSALAASAVSGTAANGYIVAAVRAALSADTPGRIVEMNVSEGSVVKAGDVVARLYSDEYAADLHRAEAELKAAEAAVGRASAERDATGAQGQRLISDAEAAAAEVEVARAAARLAALNLTRAERLLAENVQSQQMLDEALAERDRADAAEAAAAGRLGAAHAAVTQAEAELTARAAAVTEAAAQVPVAAAARDRAQATLDKTEVRAPFDGVVVLKDAEIGEVVSPNAVGSQSRGSVVTMVDFASLEVQVELPETTLSAVEVGGDAMIYLDAYPEQAYTGRVARIWPTANRQKATVEVRVAFDEPDQRMRPEMGVRVVFTPDAIDPATDGSIPEAPQGVLIPAGCVVAIDGRSGVFLLERDTVRFHEVLAGEERSGRVLIERGLDGGEMIVADPPVRLSDGDRVQVME